MVTVGQKVKFDPMVGITIFGFPITSRRIVQGTVIYVNEKHQWFLAEYKMNNQRFRTAFKFSDNEKYYKLCKGARV